ncbi:plasmid pRiA4b ORF-3 family protein [Planctomycetota bacterium]
METEKITIKLSDKQRRLLLDKVMIHDEDLERLISVVLKRGKYYQVSLTPDDLEELCGCVASEANHCQDQALVRKLYQLHDYLLKELDKYDDEAEEWEAGDVIAALEEYVNELAPFEMEEEDYEEEEDEKPNISHSTGGVFVFTAMLTEDIWRRIAIRGGQTLDDLHEAIFKAFNRFDEHLYSFYFPPPGSGSSQNLWSMVKKSTEYTHPYHLEESFGRERKRYNAQKTTIESLPLKPRRVFWYLFDFGDEWWHKIVTEKCDEKPNSGRYPRILEKKGKSPPQYEY